MLLPKQFVLPKKSSPPLKPVFPEFSGGEWKLHQDEDLSGFSFHPDGVAADVDKLVRAQQVRDLAKRVSVRQKM